jgi:hypothetical protein
MKKRFMYMIAADSLLLALGLAVMGCATTGTSLPSPPDGTYTSTSQGRIVFDVDEGTWHANALGYKGSFDFNGATSEITLNAEQKLSDLRWTDIDPIHGYISGQVKGDIVTLGDFEFYWQNVK